MKKKEPDWKMKAGLWRLAFWALLVFTLMDYIGRTLDMERHQEVVELLCQAAWGDHTPSDSLRIFRLAPRCETHKGLESLMR